MDRTAAWALIAWVFAAPLGAQSDWKPLLDLWGGPGFEQDGSLVLFFPRTDLNVMIEGEPLDPALGLTSWAEFTPAPKNVALRGELVLLDQECRKVEARALADGFTLEDLSPLLIGETPAVKLLGFSARGEPSFLSGQLKDLLRLTGTPPTPVDFPRPLPGLAEPGGPFPVGEALDEKGFTEGKTLWILWPPSRKLGDHPCGSFSLKIEKKGQDLLIFGEAAPAPAELPALLKLSAKSRWTVTDLRSLKGSDGPQPFLRWWGRGEVAGSRQALGEAASILGQTLGAAPTPSPMPRTEGF